MDSLNSGHFTEVHPDELPGKRQELTQDPGANWVGSEVRGDAPTLLLCLC